MVVRFLRDEPSSVDRSGLTGDPDIPDPPREGRPRGLRARLRAAGPVVVGTFRGMPRMIRLVWDASPLMTGGLAAGTVVSGLTPAAQAWTARLLINTVVHGIRNRAAPVAIPLPWGSYAPSLSVTNALIALAAVQFGLYLVNAVIGEIRSVAQQCLQERISQVVQLKVMEHACRLDMAFFEDSRSYDLLRQAQQEAATRPLQMVNGALSLLQAVITLTSMLALLIGLNPWLALIVLLAAVPEFVSDARFSRKGFFLAMRAAPIRRRMQYLAMLVTTDTAAKEVKLFGLGTFFTERFRLLGGEWQKVALARSFMRDAAVLILDEPTSALDAQAEFELFGRLRALAEGRTALFISHRFSTVRKADRIFFFQQSRLIEEGTHAELMRLGGHYAELFTLQASAYLD